MSLQEAKARFERCASAYKKHPGDENLKLVLLAESIYNQMGHLDSEVKEILKWQDRAAATQTIIDGLEDQFENLRVGSNTSKI